MTKVEREELKALLKQYSVRTGGDFLLVSGQRSSVYVDAKLTTCRARGTRLVGRAFLAKMAGRGWKPKAVGGLVLGADPIVMAIARESLDTGSEIDAFLVRKEAKGHGTKKHIEGVAEMAGLDVVIIDDVCTTGDSTVAAVKHARDAGMNVLGAICLVDRLMGARENLEVGVGCLFDAVFTLPELT